MAKQHIAIFKALGVPQDKIDLIEAIKDDDKEFRPDETVEIINTNMRTRLSNDQEFLDSIPDEKIPAKFKKAIESQQYARFQNELMDTYAKDLKLEVKDLTDEDKKSIRKLAEKMTLAYFSKNNNVKGLQEIQQELSETKQLLSKKDDDWTAKMADELKKGTEGYSAKLIRTLAQSALSSLPKIKLNAPPDYIVDRVLQKMNGKAKVILKGDDLGLKNKENEALEYLHPTTGKPVPFLDLLRETVLEDKIGTEEKEEGGGDNKKKKVIVDLGNGDTPDASDVPDYIQKEIDKEVATEPKQ